MAFVFFTMLFSACDMEPTDNVIPKGVDEKGIEYLQWAHPKSMWSQKYFILKSCEQKADYIELIKAGFAEEDPSSIDFWESKGETILGLNKYTDEFFDKFNLVIIPKGEGSGSIHHKVEKIGIKNKVLNIRIRRRIPGRWKTFTTDAVDWSILIPITKDYFNGDEVIVEFRDTTKG